MPAVAAGEKSSFDFCSTLAEMVVDGGLFEESGAK